MVAALCQGILDTSVGTDASQGAAPGSVVDGPVRRAAGVGVNDQPGGTLGASQPGSATGCTIRPAGGEWGQAGQLVGEVVDGPCEQLAGQWPGHLQASN